MISASIVSAISRARERLSPQFSLRGCGASCTFTMFRHVVAVVVGYSTSSEGWGMAEDHGAPEAGQLPRVWTRGRKEIDSHQRESGAKSP